MLRNLKNRAPVQARALFSQNRRFRFKTKNRSKNHRFSTCKINDKLKKIVKKTCLKTCWLLTSIFNDFGIILPPKLEAKKVIPFAFFKFFCRIGPTWPQGRPKSAPRAPQERPRASQERPRALQERPRASQERPRASHERPR